MTAIDLLSLLLGAIAGFVLAGLAAWRFGQRRFEEGRAQREPEVAALTDTRAQLDRARSELDTLSRRNAELENELRHVAARLGEKLREGERLVSELAQARESAADARLKLERLAAGDEAQRAALAQLEAFVANAREQLGAKFGEVAGELFDRKSQVFAQQSSQGLDALLRPFADEIKGFRAKVESLYGDEAKERASMRGAVEQLASLNQQVNAQTQALTNALRGNVKHRGNWGEMILDTVLQASGLVEGQHYTRQGGERDEDGRLRMPDVVVTLPDQRSVVVDSKVSLAAWQDAVNADNDEARDAALKLHVAALRRHMRELSRKDYSSMYGGRALDLVLLFVPIEGALSAALSADPALTHDALDCKIAFVTPNTLTGVLRTVEYVWAREQRLKRAEEIGSRATRMLEALGRFKTDFERIGRKLAEAHKAFDDAGISLASNRGVLNQARILQKLGVKAPLALARDHAEPEPEQMELPSLPDEAAE